MLSKMPPRVSPTLACVDLMAVTLKEIKKTLPQFT